MIVVVRVQGLGFRVFWWLQSLGTLNRVVGRLVVLASYTIVVSIFFSIIPYIIPTELHIPLYSLDFPSIPDTNFTSQPKQTLHVSSNSFSRYLSLKGSHEGATSLFDKSCGKCYCMGERPNLYTLSLYPYKLVLGKAMADSRRLARRTRISTSRWAGVLNRG